MSHEGSRQSINGIPGNWLVVLGSGFIGAMFWGFAREGNPWALLLVLPCFLVALAFFVSILKRNTFFVREPLPASHPVGSDDALAVKLRWTGRLRLHEKCAQRFIAMPVSATRLDSGAFALISRIDASTRFYGVVTQSKTGIWLTMPKPESLEIECGTLYYGLRGVPSLAMRFIDGSDGKKSWAIASFDSSEARGALLGWLNTEKEKARRQTAPMGAPAAAPIANPNSPFSSSTSGA